MIPSNFIKSLSQTSLVGGTKAKENEHVPGEVKLTTFSTNADLAVEMEAHPLLKLLKANKNDVIFRALAERHVILLIPRKESLLLASEPLSESLLERHLFLRDPKDTQRLISFQGQQAIMKSGRVYLMATHPSAASLWTLNEDTLWRTASFDSKFDAAPSVAIISETPTLCHLSSLNQSLPALLIKRPIPSKTESSPKTTTQSRPASSTGTNLMNQIQQSFSPFFTSSQPAAPPKPAEPAAATSTTEKHLKPELVLASDPAYISFTKLIRDTRFYSIALETSRFLSDEKTTTGDLDKMSERFGDWSRKVEDSVESVGNLHGFESGVMDAFLGGLHLHVLTKLHSRIWESAERESKAQERHFQIRLSVLQLSGYGLEQVLSTEEVFCKVLFSSVEWKSLVKDIGGEFLFLSHSVCIPHMIRTISTCHQNLSVFLDSLTGSSKGSADNLLPTMICIILAAHPVDLKTVSRILDVWAPSLRAEGYEQYCLTNFLAAVSYIQSIDIHSLSLPSSVLCQIPKNTVTSTVTPSPLPSLPGQSPDVFVSPQSSAASATSATALSPNRLSKKKGSRSQLSISSSRPGTPPLVE